MRTSMCFFLLYYRVTYLVLLSHLWALIPSSLSQVTEPWETAFLIDQFSCSGTLIHPDWIITAAHCINEYRNNAEKVEKLKSGEIIYFFSEEESAYPVRISGYDGPKTDFWTESKSSQIKDESSFNPNKKWRTAIQVVCHPGFQSEALSWKGNDFCLMKLSKTSLYNPKGSVIPACLPSKSFMDLHANDTYYTTGYGRRKIHFCLTDGVGPERYAVCGSPPSCRQQRRGAECGLKFPYKGKNYFKCQRKTPNPSFDNPVCEKLFNKLNEAPGVPHHVFDSKGAYNSTCYPQIKGVGWCGTRDYGDSSDKEPSFSSGWGYCSNEKFYSQCDGLSSISSIVDASAFNVQLLALGICESKLGDNLKVEQPDVGRDEYKGILDKYSVFCTGRLFPGKHDEDAFYQITEKGSFAETEASEENLLELYKNTDFKRKYLNGGPNCFGDSGGPLWKYSEIAESGKVGPVLVGVFSFMLWGTCLGRQEPPFFGRVKDKLDWIYKFIPENEVCHGK